MANFPRNASPSFLLHLMNPNLQKTCRNPTKTVTRKTATSRIPLSPSPLYEAAGAVAAVVGLAVAVSVGPGGKQVAEEALQLELPLPLEPANLPLLDFRL